MSNRPPAETDTESDMNDDRVPAPDEDPRAAYGNGVAALRALRTFEPKTAGERILADAVRTLSHAVSAIDHRVNQGFIDLRDHVDGIVEDLRNGVAGVAAAQGKLTSSADSVQELLEIVRGLDAYVRGAHADRPSEPATPSAKQRVSAVTAVDVGDEGGVAGTGDDP